MLRKHAAEGATYLNSPDEDYLRMDWVTRIVGEISRPVEFLALPLRKIQQIAPGGKHLDLTGFDLDALFFAACHNHA